MDELQVVTFENEQLRTKLTNQGSQNVSGSKPKSRHFEANEELEQLKQELVQKEAELQRSKTLNHELSLEFDKSVSKICEFERELSFYRKENHELKKTLSLFVEREQYEKMHQHRLSHDESEESEEEDSLPDSRHF